MIYHENNLVNIAFISKCILCEHLMNLINYINSINLLMLALFVGFDPLKYAV